MNLLTIPDPPLLKIINYLELKDLLALGDCHTKFREIVYKSPEIWTSDLLFPIGDKRITDRFCQRIIPRITRHYGILELRMIDLPLTWSGYLMIFDQFAHSVNQIEIEANIDELNKLSHHLSIFAGNLAMLQQNNKIPITFRQYTFDDEEEYSTALADSNYLGQRTLHNLNNYFAANRLDDPPFERLSKFKIKVSNHSDDSPVSKAIKQQLEILASFLSGSPINNNSNRSQQQPVNSRSPMPTAAYLHNNNKRPRNIYDDTASSSSGNNKHIRHDNYLLNQQQYPHHHRLQQQQEQPESPHHHLPYYSSFA